MPRALLVLFLVIVSMAASAAEPMAQLLFESRRLSPTSTFELRFANDMVAPELAGSSPAESPLAFTPPLKGTFLWLSKRSGTFTPLEIPPLGVTYKITLRRGLKDAAGREIAPGQLNESVETPPMQLLGIQKEGYYEEENIDASPEFHLLFNTEVRANEAAGFIKFINPAGVQVAAQVGQLEKADDFSLSNSASGSVLTWPEQFAPQPSDSLPPRRNLLAVKPVKPLPPGARWSLVIGPGLPSAEGKLRLPEGKTLLIGTLLPFQVTDVLAETGRNSGRLITIHFSKSIPQETVEKNLSNWIRIKPEPANLKATVEYESVTFKGDFELNKPYEAIISEAFPGEQGFLGRNVTRSVTFKRIDPRLYFEDFATHQSLKGARRFRLLSVNVPKVRVTATLFKGEAVARALEAYRKYTDVPDKMPEDEYYLRIDPAKLPGEVLWKKELAATTQVDQPVTLSLDWEEILGPGRSGAVLLTAESVDPVNPQGKRCGTQALVQVTDLGALIKRSPTASFIHLFSMASGRSLAGAKVRLLDKSHKTLVDASSDEEGNAIFPGKLSEAKWIFAELGSDTHLIGMDDDGNTIPLYRFGIEYYRMRFEEQERKMPSIFLFSERGVYKPGDTMRLKGMARDLSGGLPRVPASETVTLTLADSRRREFFRKEIVLSDYGSFSEEIRLPENSLGTFWIKAENTNGNPMSGSLSIQVQEYEPNAFEINIAEPPPLIGEAPLSLPVTASYFMGKSLSQAKLTWSLVGRDTGFHPAGLEDYAFCDALENTAVSRALDRVSQLNEQGETELDASGKMLLSTPFSLNSKAPQPRAAKLLCEVTDLNQQTVSKSRSFIRHSSEFYFGLRRFNPVLRQGEPLPLQLIAVRAEDEKAVSEPIRAKLRLTHVKWQTNRLETAGNASEYENTPVFEPVWEGELDTVPAVRKGETPPSPPRTASPASNAPAPQEPGFYLMEARGRDAKGHEVLTTLGFYVTGKGEAAWDYRNPYIIEVVADKPSYQAGQTATLLMKTPIEGQALVSVERNGVERSFITTLTGNAPTIEVPIRDGDAPNLYVSVVLLRGADESPRKIKAPEYRMGYCELKVVRPDEKLGVTIQTSAKAFQPGQPVELEAIVCDFQNKPCADAEVTLYAVDEGVLSLTGYTAPDPLPFFNRPRPLRVETSLTLSTLLREDALEAEFANKGYLIGDGKGGSGGNDGLRTNFLACALWNATLRTDSKGRVQAKFQAPDSLTRYRVIAVAQTRQSQFGTGESSFEINKPLMLEPALPRFANLGDQLTLRAVLHNTTEVAGDVDLELLLDSTAKTSSPARRIPLPAHGSVAVDFPVEFIATGKAQWRWNARFSGKDGKVLFHDAVQSELSVGSPATLIREVHTSRIEKAETDLMKIFNPQILEGVGQAEVSLANTRVIELRESLHSLLHYPYGCVEQTTSAMLPWLALRELRGTLPELAKTDEEIAAAVSKGVALLLSMQHGSGGLGYWPEARAPMLWGSAYGGLGLALAQKQGFDVPAEEYQKLLRYLSEQLRTIPKDATGYGLSAHCLALYTLAVAGQAEPAYHEFLFKKRSGLTSEDRALLALAIIESGGPGQMLQELLLAGPTGYAENAFGSAARENAMQLLAWLRYRPSSPLIDQLALELFSRRQNGHWSTTQGNAWSLLALGNYLREMEQGDKQVTGMVEWAGQKQPFALSEKEKSARTIFPIAPATAHEPIKLLKTTGGPLFSEVTIEAWPRVIEQPRQDRGFAIERRYEKLEDDGKVSPLATPRVGDLILITLTIVTRGRSTFVAVEDPLPAVLAAINPAFESQETIAGEQPETSWVSDYSELRKDRALFFADQLNPGRYILRYLARVVAAGKATAPAAKIEQMYHPERFGTSGTLKVEALPLKAP